MCFVCMYVCISPGDSRGQKRPPDPLGLELLMVVSLHEGAGNRALVLWKAASVLNH